MAEWEEHDSTRKAAQEWVAKADTVNVVVTIFGYGVKLS